ncbi:MAG: DUF177 domain-containing protein [Hyphomonadaceae bacterium]|nr:DUF177 domain-containing protein [Clostridia bacterium]
MVIDVTSIVKYEGAKLDFMLELKPPQFTFNGIDVLIEAPMQIQGSIVNNGSNLQMQARVNGEIQVQCDRCTAAMVEPIHFEFEELFILDSEGANKDDDSIVLNNHQINAEHLLCNQLILNLPLTFLCNEQCKGLCPECYADLNKAPCNCNNKQIDPRFAALKKLLDE